MFFYITLLIYINDSYQNMKKLLKANINDTRKIHKTWSELKKRHLLFSHKHMKVLKQNRVFLGSSKI